MQRPPNLVNSYEDSTHFIAENYAIHMQQANKSSPPIQERSAEQAGNTVLRFVFWGHVPQNQRHAIPLLEGCDILAVENVQDRVYENVDQRQRGQSINKTTWRIISALVTGSFEAGEEQRLRRRGINPAEYVGIEPKARKEAIRRLIGPVHRDLFAHFVDKVEKVAELDMELKHAPRLDMLKSEAQRKREIFLDLIFNPASDWQQLRDQALDYLNANVAADQFRESIALEQIKRLADNNPGKTIGILYGLRHQTLTRKLEAHKVGLQRRFAKNDFQTTPTIRTLFSIDHHLESCLRSGIYDLDDLDQHLAINLVVVLTGGKITTQQADRLFLSGQLPVLTRQLSELWQQYPASETSAAAIEDRQKKTTALIRGAIPKRRIFSLKPKA